MKVGADGRGSRGWLAKNPNYAQNSSLTGDHTAQACDMAGFRQLFRHFF
jgi:hypothetical protein